MKINNKINKTFYKQLEQSDCGPASLYSILRYYGGNYPFSKLREICGTNKNGTSLYGIFEAANKIGFEAEAYEVNDISNLNNKSPYILHVFINDKSHFVVLYTYNYKKDEYLIGDPSTGLYVTDLEGLNKIWLSKYCISLSPNLLEKITKSNNILKWLFKLIIEDTKFLKLSLFLGIVISILNLSTAIFSQKLVDKILPSNNISKIVSSIILFFLVLLIKQSLTYYRSNIIYFYNMKFSKKLFSEILNRILKLNLYFFTSRNNGDIVARLNDISRIQNNIKLVLNEFIIDLLVILTTIIFLYYIDSNIALIYIISIPIYILIINSFSNKYLFYLENVMINYSINESSFFELSMNVQEYKSNNKEKWLGEKIQNKFNDYQKSIYDLSIFQSKLNLFSSLISILIFIVVISYAVYLVVNDQIKIGELVGVITINTIILSSIINISLIPFGLKESEISILRLKDIFEVTFIKNNKFKSFDINSFNIKDLSFRYFGTSKYILSEINLEINKSSITVIKGKSGVGKTTFINILNKTFTNYEGSILINHKELKEVDSETWNNNIYVINQFPILINGSLAENITLGDDLNLNKLNTIINEYSIFNMFINKFNDLNILLGENGIKISGGEKFILSLLRCIYHDKQIIILDEPTASLDIETSYSLIGLLEKLKNNRFIIVITHQHELFKNSFDTLYELTDSKLIKHNQNYRQN